MRLLLFLAIFAALGGYCLSAYRGLAVLRQRVADAWGEVDALLTRRHDELSPLFESCGRHLPGQRQTLQRAAKARDSVFAAAGRREVAAVGAAESLLRSGLGQLLAAADDHPALHADESFCRTRVSVERLLDDIAERRERYNGEVNLYNVRLCRWPGAIIARVLGLRDATLFEFTGA